MLEPIERRGMMFVLSSPSGAGKTTLTHRLLAADANVRISISITTRPRRETEKDGIDYHFRSVEDFGLMVNRGDFLEHAKVFGHYYGTPRAPVLAWLEEGRDVLFDVDWQGTQQLAQVAPEDLVRVFVLPPSRRELELRLKNRKERTEVIADRMARANDEISHWAEYDYIVINADIDAAEREVKSILAAERLKRHRQIGLVNFVKRLTSGI